MTTIEDPARTTARAALLDPSLAAIVDMVFSVDGAPEAPVYEAASADGAVRFTRHADGQGWAFDVVAVDGVDPVADQSTDRFAPLADERSSPFPDRGVNAYPFAFEQVAQLFDSPSAPDLVVQHSAAHNWEDQGGHRGEHGSIGVVQARAPFVMAGAGVARRGLVPAACRLVDVAPTVLALAGAAPIAAEGAVGQNGRAFDGALLARQDGRVLDDLIEGDAPPPEHVVGILWDGTNANVLYELAAQGKAPNVARLMEMGTTYGHGAMSSLPTVTLANHTSILTGRLPGHHGILHNAWYDRKTASQVITNSQATWPWSMQHLVEGVESLHDAVHRATPGAFTASVNEPCDLGADYSTFDYFRRGEVPPIPETPNGLPHVTERFVRPSKDYAWSTVVDHMGVEQAVGIWSGHYRDVSFPRPRFMWCNFTLTDSAFHAGGPYSDIAAASVRDSDARVGEVLAAVERAGVFDDTAFVLVADHGMQETDPSVTGDWDVALRAAGITFRDEGYGFLYLGEE
jgi:hypothetical protein